MKKIAASRVPIPRNYFDYQARQRQTAQFKATAKPAKLSTSAAAKIRQQLNKMLNK